MSDHKNAIHCMANDKLGPMDSNELNRQTTTLTMQLSADQYERLFFQPEKAKGDLAKRFANPTLLGLVGLLIPFQITMWCLLQFKGSDLTSLVSVSGSLYFMGGIAMNIAGLAEFILGNSFPFAVFIIYGCHWLVLAYTGDPSHLILNAFGPEGMAGKPWNSGQGHYALVMAFVSFIFLLGALRTNVPFVIMFFTLVILFGFIAVADYGLGNDSSPEGVQFAGNLLKIAGGFGIVTAIMGWYLAVITACASTGVPCPLPIFDLSQRFFPHSKPQSAEHAGAVPRRSEEV